MNSVTITGNLVADPEKGQNTGDTLIANFRIGNSEYAGPDKEPFDNGFHDVTVFNDQARNVLDKLSKGQRVIVSGRLQQRTFEREDGSKGARISLVAQAVGISLEFKDKS